MIKEKLKSIAFAVGFYTRDIEKIERLSKRFGA